MTIVGTPATGAGVMTSSASVTLTSQQFAVISMSGAGSGVTIGGVSISNSGSSIPASTVMAGPGQTFAWGSGNLAYTIFTNA